MASNLGDTLLTVQCGCLLQSDFPSDTIVMLHHLIFTCSYGPFYGGRSLIIINNCTQIALRVLRKTAGRKASLQALALLPVERW